MLSLTNTKYGTRRKAVIGGVNFNLLSKNMEIIFYIQLIDAQGKLLDDKSINQNMVVTHSLDNYKKVDTQFNYVESGGAGEYDYFLELMNTLPLPSLILQLAQKLNERGIFN